MSYINKIIITAISNILFFFSLTISSFLTTNPNKKNGKNIIILERYKKSPIVWSYPTKHASIIENKKQTFYFDFLASILLSYILL